MATFPVLLEKLSAAATPAEYLAIQRQCLAVATEEEVMRIVRAPEADGSRRLDSLQILYWLTAPDERTVRFQRLFEEAGEGEREMLKALHFRALTEGTMRSSHPERADRYLESVRAEFAKSLYAS